MQTPELDTSYTAEARDREAAGPSRGTPHVDLPWGATPAQALDDVPRQVVAAARRQNPLDILRGMMERDPQTVADVAWKAMKEGRDVRAITAMLDRTYGEETGHVEEPHTFDELAKLSRAQRRALITQLERAGRGSPFRMPEH
jgi:hypothetical protein